MDIINRLKGLIDKSQRPLITAHIRLDGDALGSELALYHVLRALGKEPSIINDSPIPRVYKFLVKDVEVKTWTALPEEDFDLVIVVDTPNVERLGRVSQLLKRKLVAEGEGELPIINIDHHVCNKNFGTLNWVDPAKSSSGEMVYDLLVHLRQTETQLVALGRGIEITPGVAEALYVAIITDTGRFTHNNTTPESFKAAAQLVELGADPAKIGNHLYRGNTYGQFQLISLAAKTLTLHANKRIACLCLTRDMLREAHTPSIDTQDFADIPISLEGVEVGVLLRELGEPNKIKVSLRSRDGVDVNELAQHFGGGGHERAAGFELQGSIQEVQARVVEEIEKILEPA